MRKMAILAVLATALISCGNTYTAKTVELTNQNDSVNYAVGLVNGANIKMQQLRNDSSDKAVAEFIDAMQRGYDGKVEELSDVASIGQNVGIATKACETKGLAENPAWTLNEKIFFQGLVNGIYDDQSVMAVDVAKEQDIVTPELKEAGDKLYLLRVLRDNYDQPNYDQAKLIFEVVRQIEAHRQCQDTDSGYKWYR